MNYETLTTADKNEILDNLELKDIVSYLVDGYDPEDINEEIETTTTQKQFENFKNYWKDIINLSDNEIIERIKGFDPEDIKELLLDLVEFQEVKSLNTQGDFEIEEIKEKYKNIKIYRGIIS